MEQRLEIQEEGLTVYKVLERDNDCAENYSMEYC